MEGKTGYPIVDAAMRQLNATGWMHNRLRMIVASFLTKDLLVDWRIGENYFRSQLLDGDIASNVGGWQWAASTGTDAQPWFRVFNPVAQGMKFDPAGSFVREWLPELQNVPDKFIHAPWLMSYSETTWLGFQLGRDYPNPIVDHGVQRLLALDMFKKVALTREPS
jgi:deoxyribodipyrimidine photo-lyase